MSVGDFTLLSDATAERDVHGVYGCGYIHTPIPDETSSQAIVSKLPEVGVYVGSSAKISSGIQGRLHEHDAITKGMKNNTSKHYRYAQERDGYSLDTIRFLLAVWPKENDSNLKTAKQLFVKRLFIRL
ncbi:hypothetical protein BJ508DRAFT_417606, partial [Ascobolus immersus RN42]